MAQPLQRFSILNDSMATFQESDITDYRGFQIQRHFVRTDNYHRPVYEYRVVGYPTAFTSRKLACDEVDYLINKRNSLRESC